MKEGRVNSPVSRLYGYGTSDSGELVIVLEQAEYNGPSLAVTMGIKKKTCLHMPDKGKKIGEKFRKNGVSSEIHTKMKISLETIPYFV